MPALPSRPRPFFIAAVVGVIVLFGTLPATLASARSRASESAPPAPTVDWLLETAASADAVVHGRVVEQTVHWDELRTSIVTDNIIAVSSVVAGELPAGAPVTVRTIGGELAAEGIALGVTHEAQLALNEEVILLLNQDAASIPYYVIGGERGKMTVDGDYAFSEAVRSWLPLADLVPALAGDAGEAVTALHDLQQKMTRLPTPEGTETHVNTGIRWPGDAPTVSFVLNINSSQVGGEDGDQAAFQAAVLDAAADWTAVSSADFTFAYAGPTTVTDVEASNGINEIIFVTAGRSGTLGRTRFWYNPTTQLVNEADVWFNDSYDFDATGAPGGGEIDLQSVALHEFGHWFVLGHDDNAAAVMYYAISGGAVKRTLHPSDIAGVAEIYPCENQPCGGASEPPVPPEPTEEPTDVPTEVPTEEPTAQPTEEPTEEPTAEPTEEPTAEPTEEPTAEPTEEPTEEPTVTPDPPPHEPAPTYTPTSEPTVPPTPPLPETAQLLPGQAATVQFGSEGDSPALILNVPDNAVSEVTVLGYADLDEPPSPAGTSGAYAGARFELSASQAGGAIEAMDFMAPVRFEVAYPAPAGAIAEASVRLYRFDLDAATWVPATCGSESVDPGQHVAHADVCLTGEFALFAQTDVNPDEMTETVFLPLIERE